MGNDKEDNANDNNKPTDFELYQTLIQARNYHYDNFNKWASYFYIAIGALFAGYYTLKSSENSPPPPKHLEYALLALGFVVSLLWYWSCKRYYYWNINWIMLVNKFEKDVLKLDLEKRIYTVFANKDTQNNYYNPISGANISTSKVAILFAFIVTVLWGVLLIEEIAFYHVEFDKKVIVLLNVTLAVIIITALSALLELWHNLIGKYFTDLSLVSDHSFLENRGLGKKKFKWYRRILKSLKKLD